MTEKIRWQYYRPTKEYTLELENGVELNIGIDLANPFLCAKKPMESDIWYYEIVHYSRKTHSIIRIYSEELGGEFPVVNNQQDIKYPTLIMTNEHHFRETTGLTNEAKELADLILKAIPEFE